MAAGYLSEVQARIKESFSENLICLYFCAHSLILVHPKRLQVSINIDFF